ncbi:MAG TPA: zinc ABC transporter substrate-binding protein [Planctomycetaceae bacterium]|nr:zinc ABC transporter substrate-binding protein [Planctomycetaceae bacterium]
MTHVFLSVLVSAAALAIAGCTSGATPASSDGTPQTLSHEREAAERSLSGTFAGSHPIQVVATSGMVADLVRNVGGTHVRVHQLMGEGVDPHLYNPTPGDVRRLSDADAIFFSGLHLEGKMSEIFESIAREKPTVPVTLRIAAERLIKADKDYYDPHVWFDVALWSEAAQAVGDVLAKFDPDHADDYQQNTAAFRERLAELDEFCRQEMAAVPEQQRVLVTAHDAFHYFGRAYGVEVKAIQGVSTASEASLARINQLVDFMVQNKIKAVFVESSVPERNVRSLIEGCAARGHTVATGGELFSDAMGAPGTPEGTYEGMVRHNVETIRDALQ